MADQKEADKKESEAKPYNYVERRLKALAEKKAKAEKDKK